MLLQSFKGAVKTATTCKQTTDTTDQTEAHAFKLSEIGVDLTERSNRRRQSVFSRDPLDLGHTDLIQHEIKLSDETPFTEQVRRIFTSLV